MPDARTAILARIREQLPPAGSPCGDYAAIPRTYTQRPTHSPRERTTLLLERLRDYDAEVVELPDDIRSTIAQAVFSILVRDHETVLLVPPGIPAEWLPLSSTTTIEILPDTAHALPREALTRAQAVLTTCSGAIAETGTLLLTHDDPAQGRRVLTLLPDHHLCILRLTQVVETVPEGLALIAAQSGAPVTTVSGPSATADIEMTRIRGVHGPRRLTVLLIP